MADGTRLSAKLWLPDPPPPGGVPAILEYAPYRKDDATAAGDEAMFAWFAARGYACVRVDLRGCGDSDGILAGEYLAQEQDDALEVLAWIAAQPWSDGGVGMIGLSWTGFNGLQVAYRRPPQLKAVISCCSTDDRYANDIHYMGGCVLGVDMLSWAATMLGYNARPPQPDVVGDSWRESWLRRIEETPPFVEDWLAHQRRDAFWQHGSICEDYNRDRGAATDGRRLGRRLPQHRPARARALRRAVQGADRPVVAPLRLRRPARPIDRLPAGGPALVGSLAQGRRHRRARGAGAAGVDAGVGARRRGRRRSPRPLGRRGRVARARPCADHSRARTRRPRRAGGRRRRDGLDRGHARERRRLGRLARLRPARRRAARAARRGRPLAVLRHASPRAAPRAARHPRARCSRCARTSPAP